MAKRTREHEPAQGGMSLSTQVRGSEKIVARLDSGVAVATSQRELYEIALGVQKAVIENVRPGVTWWELHRLAERMLREAGGYDEHWTYGIGHFIGMEVHDEGDYSVPLQPGMALSIEQGVAPPGLPRIAFEDDVLVTETGHVWLSRSIPIEIDEIEVLRQTPSSLAPFVIKRRPY